MKVTFKLNNRQELIAIGVLSRWAANFDNMANGNQKFTREGNLLTYEGERAPLIHGLSSYVVKALGGPDELKVVSYETTDPRLQWHQTLVDAANGWPLEKQLDELEALQRTASWKFSIGAIAYAAGFKAKKRAVELALHKPDRVAQAQLSRAEYTLRARVLKLIPDYNLRASAD